MMRQWFNGKMLLYQRSAGVRFPLGATDILFYILTSKRISVSIFSNQDAKRMSSVSRG